MKGSARLAAMGVVSLLGLLVGYGLIFAFYLSGLAGSTGQASAAVWETVLRRTVVLGPFLGGFLLLACLAWFGRWSTGVAPFAFGSIAVLLLARRDAGILEWADALWVVIFGVIVFASRKRVPPGDDGDEEDGS